MTIPPIPPRGDEPCRYHRGLPTPALSTSLAKACWFINFHAGNERIEIPAKKLPLPIDNPMSVRYCDPTDMSDVTLHVRRDMGLSIVTLRGSHTGFRSSAVLTCHSSLCEKQTQFEAMRKTICIFPAFLEIQPGQILPRMENAHGEDGATQQAAKSVQGQVVDESTSLYVGHG